MRTTKVSLVISATVVSLSVLGSSCMGRQESGPTDSGSNERTELVRGQIAGPDDYPIPTPVEVVSMLQRAGAPYVLGVSNPVSNADKYFTEKSKALNLGVYGADLSYAATYEMNQEIRRYLQVSKQLIDDLNISTSFNRQLVDQVERNLDNKDTLIHLVSDVFHDTYDFLTSNRRDDLSLLVVTGSWIEGMYITSQIALGARDNHELTGIILQQDGPLEVLLSIMEEYPDLEDLYNELHVIYDFLQEQQSPMAARNLDLFAGMIEELRTEIVRL
jgi:hypothetical protein